MARSLQIAQASLPIAVYGKACLRQILPGFDSSAKSGAGLIVIDPPVLDDPFCLGQRGEPVQVQAFFAKPAVETFDVGVLGRLARVDEVELHAVIHLPSHQARGLVVQAHCQRSEHPGTPAHEPPVPAFPPRGSRDRQGHINRRTFPCAVVFQIDGAELPAVGERIHGEVQAPPLVGGDRAPGAFAHALGDFLAIAAAQGQALPLGKVAPPLSRSP